MIETVLFVITFVFGTIKLLSLTKMFDIKTHGLVEAVSPFSLNEFWTYVNTLAFYASLCYQTYFLFTKTGLLTM